MGSVGVQLGRVFRVPVHRVQAVRDDLICVRCIYSIWICGRSRISKIGLVGVRVMYVFLLFCTAGSSQLVLSVRSCDGGVRFTRLLRYQVLVGVAEMPGRAFAGISSQVRIGVRGWVSMCGIAVQAVLMQDEG